MPSVSTYGATSDPYVNGLLMGVKWATTSLTYSFPTAASFYGANYGDGEPNQGFQALNATQQTAVRSILVSYAAASNLTFSEVTESSNLHGDLRFAESNVPSTAWAYYPWTSPEGGDVWFNSSDYNGPTKGNYAYLTVLHEIGHALGLKHAHEVDGAFGAMPVDKDFLAYTVMSYRSYEGRSTSGGYINGNVDFPQSLMMYDIAAVQRLYGADYNTNSGNTTYSWSSSTGQMSINGVGQGAPAGNRIFLTTWDGNGNDTYDFSNYSTNLTVNLAPGAWSTTSSAQLARLHWNGSVLAPGNIANALMFDGDVRSLIENAIGGSANDQIAGNQAANLLNGGSGNDVLTGLEGNDTLEGGLGSDTAVYRGALSDYQIASLGNGSIQVRDLRAGSSDGEDLAWNIEFFQFSNGTFASSSFQVTLVGDDNDNVLSGGPGNDTMFGYGGNDTIYGRGGNDTLWGGTGNDRLEGGAGDDYLFGEAGNDVFVDGEGVNTFQGGPGDDTYAVQSSNDRVVEFANEGRDQVQTFLDYYVLTANVEDLVFNGSGNHTGVGNSATNWIWGGPGNDYLIGLEGNDVLIDGMGLNTLQGGMGNEIYAVQSRDDTVWEFPDEGIDQVQTFLPYYELRLHVEDLVFVGDWAHEGVGTTQDNRLTGAPNSDKLTGAGGADIFDYRNAANGHDTITDFDAVDASGGHDRIDLSGRGFTFASLTINASGSDTIVGFGSDTIVLQGVNASQVNHSDFLFG